jgi:hypothetical protein
VRRRCRRHVLRSRLVVIGGDGVVLVCSYVGQAIPYLSGISQTIAKTKFCHKSPALFGANEHRSAVAVNNTTSASFVVVAWAKHLAARTGMAVLAGNAMACDTVYIFVNENVF